MIITCDPLCISIGGCRIDVPSYFNKRKRLLISVCIEKYLYMSHMETFLRGILFNYFLMDNVKNINDIKNLIIFESLKYFNKKDGKLEITSFEDIPINNKIVMVS